MKATRKPGKGCGWAFVQYVGVFDESVHSYHKTQAGAELSKWKWGRGRVVDLSKYDMVSGEGRGVFFRPKV